MIIIDVTSDYLHAKYNKGEILYKKCRPSVKLELHTRIYI